MSARGKSLTVAGVLMAAFLGGAASHLLFDGSAARAADQGYVLPAEALQGQVIHALGFVVVDATGKELARLGPSDKGVVCLTVMDGKGKERLRVGALEPAGFGMDAHDADGHMRASIGYWADDVGGMRVYDATNVKRVGLGLGPQGCGLSMQNSAGVNILGAGVGPGAGGGDFFLNHPDGHEIWRASAAAQAPSASTQPAAPAK